MNHMIVRLWVGSDVDKEVCSVEDSKAHPDDWDTTLLHNLTLIDTSSSVYTGL